MYLIFFLKCSFLFPTTRFWVGTFFKIPVPLKFFPPFLEFFPSLLYLVNCMYWYVLYVLVILKSYDGGIGTSLHKCACLQNCVFPNFRICCNVFCAITLWHPWKKRLSHSIMKFSFPKAHHCTSLWNEQKIFGSEQVQRSTTLNSQEFFLYLHPKIY